MIKIKNKQDCCGCNACGDVCVSKAIYFERDDGGFLYPKVDKDRCVECNICNTVCPIDIVEELRNKNEQKTPTAFGAISNNLEIRFDSTSGGLFSVFADYIFKERGYVGGAIWDDNYFVQHILTNRQTDLLKLRSSKYAQSDARGFYCDVKEKLVQGYKVLVCGLPCQMTALRSFLGQDYENLIIIDLICHSVSSPYFLKYYLKMHENDHNAKVINIKQKDKGLGWRNLTTKLTFDNGEILYDPKRSSYFMRAFEANLISRPSCYSCKFRGFPRLADITLADCWGAVDKLPKEMDHDIGTSLVLCNTKKGQSFWNVISGKEDVSFYEVDLNDVIKGNFGLLDSIPYPTVDVSHLYYDLKNKTIPEVLDPILNSKKCLRQQRRTIQFLKKIKNYPKSIIYRLQRIIYYRKQLYTIIKINGLKNLINGKPLLIPKGTFVFDAASDAVVISNANTSFGASLLNNDKSINRLKMYKGSKIIVNGGSIGRDCYILLFENSCLEIGKNCCINVNFCVSCAEHIKIGDNVFIGQHVTIRDTHGDHYINTPGYKATKPIIIGDHVWICSEAMIMPGVKIGSGSIVAAKSIVTHDVPPCSLVAGIPAKVIRNNVQFRC